MTYFSILHQQDILSHSHTTNTLVGDYITLMCLDEGTQALNTPTHIVSISFICCNIKKHTSFILFSTTQIVHQQKKRSVYTDIHEPVTTGLMTFCSAGIALRIGLN